MNGSDTARHPQDTHKTPQNIARHLQDTHKTPQDTARHLQDTVRDLKKDACNVIIDIEGYGGGGGGGGVGGGVDDVTKVLFFHNSCKNAIKNVLVVFCKEKEMQSHEVWC